LENTFHAKIKDFGEINNQIVQQLLFGCKLICNWPHDKKAQLIATFTIAISKEIYCVLSSLCEMEEQHCRTWRMQYHFHLLFLLLP
jgi:hypothetical protein